VVFKSAFALKIYQVDFFFNVDDFDILMFKIKKLFEKNYFNIFLNKKIFLKNILYHNNKYTLGIRPFSSHALREIQMHYNCWMI